MDQHALEHYQSYSDNCPHAHYHSVIALHEDKEISWQTASELAPKLCRGWYELAHLAVQDRIEFTREFWCTKFSSNPKFVQFLVKFFSTIDDIGVYLTQQCHEDPFQVQLVYSLKDNGGFFRGRSPIQEDEIIALQKVFTDYILPADYLDFLRIHNGFAKQTDSGIQQSSELATIYEELQEFLKKGEPLHTTSGVPINPKSLIPFYRSFSMPFFQCFCGEWYPDQEMGNVYYSAVTHTISDFTKQSASVETMAFDTFTDWLIFYLEKIV